jgi:hypothetical protein
MSRYRIVVALTSLMVAFVPSTCHPEVQMRSICLEGPLYSARAIRRAKVLLQLQLLQMREEGLDRARAAVERKITIDQLLDPHPPSEAKVQGVVPSSLKQRQAFGTTKCL